MSANVETMFSVRETPWHGLGRIIMDAPASREALELAGLDWQVESRNIYSGTGAMIPGYRANVRSTDEAVLGVVSDRYRIIGIFFYLLSNFAIFFTLKVKPNSKNTISKLSIHYPSWLIQ